MATLILHHPTWLPGTPPLGKNEKNNAPLLFYNFLSSNKPPTDTSTLVLHLACSCRQASAPTHQTVDSTPFLLLFLSSDFHGKGALIQVLIMRAVLLYLWSRIWKPVSYSDICFVLPVAWASSSQGTLLSMYLGLRTQPEISRQNQL